MAFAAAIAPNQYGSSTRGVKTSTVWTRARSGAMRYTPASSAVLVATRTAGSVTGGRWRRTCARSAGPSLEAQPAQATIEVSLIRSRSVMDRSVSDVGATLIVTPAVPPKRNPSAPETQWRITVRNIDGHTATGTPPGAAVPPDPPA